MSAPVQFDTSLRVIDAGYAWSECPECGNTIKFGPGATPATVCPACSSRFIADRAAKTVTCTLKAEEISDEDFWAEQDADLYD